ncbi:endonuclease/exonuclease/phosphatase family protein [uncultured Gimesia sp.]|uniref:endonuclease/exonuclease/phosphatase family protein n=1 Tax=uncultured Gimesia sp. TaxID=1678688 RepID=UPI002626E5C6|nr:endonuclease/exonuclease/phosphatase family protein [uncultured Gimesia sp.]
MSDSHTSAQTRTPSCLVRVVFPLVTGFSLLLFVFLTLCYVKQYDACAAVTVYPSWCWFLCGFFLAMVLLRTHSRRTALLTLSLWFLFLIVFADTPLSLVRGIQAPGPQPSVRVISLNCSGSKTSVLALKQAKPDLILIQESPGTENLKSIAVKLFGAEGDVLSGVDAAIIARGKIERIGATDYYIIGKVTLSPDREIIVVSLRLSTPPFRIDLWNPDCWRSFRDHRIKQRAEIVALSKVMQSLPADLPVIVGGDFNANPRDAIFAELPATLHDSFSSAGRGWGNTITNDVPFLRIDQIWTNDWFQPLRVVSEAAVDTDHRAVIADLIFKP